MSDVIVNLIGGVIFETTAPHYRNVFFGTAAFVFILWGVALIVIQAIALLARQAEKSRQILGEKGPGYAAVLDRSFRDPRFKPRFRVMWMVELGVGVVALFALFVG